MKQPTCRRLSRLIATLLVACLLPAAQAQDLGRMKVQRTDGKWVTGEVQETADAYIVKVSKSITVTIRKNEVRAILPAEEADSQPGDAQGQAASENPDRVGGGDAEIEKLLEGTDLELPVSELALEESELPLDEQSVAEMKRMAGTDNIWTTKHVVVVYTSSKREAVDIAERLEAIWRWRMKFMKMINVPVRLPAHKLELYYFGTHVEFDALRMNMGESPEVGLLGFFDPRSNRSHFFNMLTWPPVKARLEAAQKAKGPQKAREENLAKIWSGFNTIETTQHELGHHIDFNVGLFPRYSHISMDSMDSLPRWLIEGTTMMFEVPLTSEGASLGTVNYARLEEFRKHYPKPSPKWLKLFLVDNSVWLKGGGTFYPMGWGLVYYLWEEKRAGLSNYYQIMAARDPGDYAPYSQREQEFEECFGKVDEKWIDDWWTFMKELPVKRSVLPPEGYPFK